MSAKFLSKELKEASKNKNIRAKRLTSPHRLMRNGKADIITSFFEEVKTLDLRNQMSQHIYNNRLEFYHRAADFVKSYQQFHKQCKYLGSWSIQSMYSEVGTKYVTMFNMIFEYSIKKFIYKWYHEGKKFNKTVEKTILRQIEVVGDSIRKGFNTIVAIKDYYNAYRNADDPVMDIEDVTNLLIFMKNVNKVISNSDGEYYLI